VALLEWRTIERLCSFETQRSHIASDDAKTPHDLLCELNRIKKFESIFHLLIKPSMSAIDFKENRVLSKIPPDIFLLAAKENPVHNLFDFNFITMKNLECFREI